MEAKKVKLTKINANPENPRVLKDWKFDKLKKSIQDFPEMMQLREIVVDEDMNILGGNMRYRVMQDLKIKECPVKIAAGLSDAQKKEFIIKDNLAYGEWDMEELANSWDADLLEEWGFDMPDWWNEEDKEEASISLQERFVVPPFSILDTRQGYWQDRKKYWKTIINEKGESRFESMGKFNPEYKKSKKLKTGFKSIGQNVSLLDPVLAEISNKWFGLENCKTFDPFAGDTVFGYVADYLGNLFTGIELRQEQADLNNERLSDLKSKYICDDGQNVLKHIKENSQDLLFSCPPYFDLEKYSDLEKDASNQKDYKDFIKIIDNAFSDSIKCLKNNRFAVIVVGDIRDKKGFYRNFIGDVKNIFIKNNMLLYNELILIEQIGTKAMLVNKAMNNRKIGKCHQNVLVFYKGNPKEIKNIYPVLDFSDLKLEDESTDI